MRRRRVFWFLAVCGGDSLESGGRQAAGFVSVRRRQVSAAAAGFWAAASAKDHVDVDHGDDFVGDVELDEDVDVVVQVGLV